MRAIHFAPPVGSRQASAKRSTSLSDKLGTTDSSLASPHKPLLSPGRAAMVPSRRGTTEGPLPPLVKVQGPFKPPEEVRRLKNKPPNPTLRVATSYDHKELKR